MILGSHQNWFYYLWTTTQIYIDFINLFPKLILAPALETKGPAVLKLAQRPEQPRRGRHA